MAETTTAHLDSLRRLQAILDHTRQSIALNGERARWAMCVIEAKHRRDLAAEYLARAEVRRLDAEIAGLGATDGP